MKKIYLTKGKCIDCNNDVSKKSQKPSKRCDVCLIKRKKKLSKISQRKYRNNNIERVRKSARDFASKKRRLYPTKTHQQDRKSALKKNYGITLKEYEILFNKQNGVCAICHKSETRTKYLCVDHNHGTGEIRGLLCTKCNLALGYINDSILLLEEMIKYIKR